MFTTHIIPRETISVMVDSYESACKDLIQAGELMKSASNKLKAAYGDNYSTFSGWPNNQERSMSDVTKHVKQNCWQTIINRLEIKKFMSIKDIEDLGKRLEDIENIPELNLENVMDIVTGMVTNAPDYAKRLVNEVYEILMPGTRSTEYKTNLKNARRALGKKVILKWVVEIWYPNHFHVPHTYSKYDKVMAIDKVFHALDGRALPANTYSAPLAEAIEKTVISSPTGETEYFKFRCCQNGNLHLEFKRIDLVQKLNQIAGAGSNRIGD